MDNRYAHISHKILIIIHKFYMKAYQIIKEYYGTQCAKRSGVPLMNHIDEGIEILKSINAEQDVIDAYCLHPILQSDEAFNQNYTMTYLKIRLKSLLGLLMRK